jgi:hypothetical protein
VVSVAEARAAGTAAVSRQFFQKLKEYGEEMGYPAESDDFEITVDEVWTYVYTQSASRLHDMTRAGRFRDGVGGHHLRLLACEIHMARHERNWLSETDQGRKSAVRHRDFFRRFRNGGEVPLPVNAQELAEARADLRDGIAAERPRSFMTGAAKPAATGLPRNHLLLLIALCSKEQAEQYPRLELP